MKPTRSYKLGFITMLLLFSSHLSAKDFTLSGYVKGFEGKTVMLAYITNLRMNPIDTVKVINGKFTFDISKRKAGMYSIIFDYGIYADIIINNENIEFRSILVNGNNVEDSIRFSKSEENKIYYEYLKYKNWANYRVAYEKHQGSEWFAKDAVGNAKKLDSLRLHIDWLQRSISDKAYQLYKKHPTLFVAKKLKFYLSPNFDDYKKLSGDKKYSNETDFLREHFYDNVDINDTNLLDVAYLNNTAVFYLMNYTTPQNIIRGCDFILEKMKPNKEALCSVLDVMIKQMENWDLDSVYVYLSENYYQKGYCDDDTKKNAVIKMAIMLKQLSFGNSFPDIVLSDSAAVTHSLYSLKNEITLVFFWLSTCEHCEKMVPEIKSIYDKYKDKGFEVYAVSLDENKENWLTGIKKNNMKWLNVAELKGFQGEVSKQFNISKTPRLYLIDKNKRVISHPLNAEQIRQTVENYLMKK